MIVYYGGEDQVTKLIAKQLIRYAAQLEGLDDITLDDANPRDYGTRALEKLKLIIQLSVAAPVVCVFDSDGDCVVELLKKYAGNWKNQHLAINIAIDEGETWLMADRRNFSDYFGLKLSLIPDKKENSQELSESIPYKTILYFLQQLVPHSRKKKVLKNLTCERPGKKPPTYNALWAEFIEKYWDIAIASNNSDSLLRAITRVRLALRNNF